jgi:proprotein convertase subtilisin/kexin type 5
MDGINCTICDSKCSTCNVSATNCSVCKSTAYLLTNTCYTQCPDPYYNDNNGGIGPNLCLQCDGSCASCTTGTNTSCSSCTTNYTLSSTTCDTTCLPGYGISSSVGICIQCISPCTDCYLGGTNCTACITTPSQYYLITISGSTNCVSSCPVVGYYLNSSMLTCFSCPIGCYDCSS